MYKIVNKKKLLATKIADTIGKVLFYPACILKRTGPIQPESVKSILLIRTVYIGDVVMTLPMLKPLKERFPNSSITFLTTKSAAPLFENNRYVDRVITYDPFWFHPSPKSDYIDYLRRIRKEKFDLVIEARADIREIMGLLLPVKAKHKVSYAVGGGAYLLTDVVPYEKLKHKVEYHLDIARHIGCDIGEPEFPLEFTKNEIDGVDKLLAENRITEKFICVHPGSRLKLKMWHVGRYARLCNKIYEETKVTLALLGHGSEKEVTDEIVADLGFECVNLTGRVNLRELALVLGKSSLLVCNDSAPMHIARAMGTPVAALFGPSKSVETAPYGTGSKVIEKDFECRSACDESSCSHERLQACMEDITMEEVYNTVLDLLEKSEP